jgi:hypothetical protein
MFLAYGLGWFTWPFWDQRAVSHGGRIDGMSAMMGFLPDAGIGVVVLTNLDQTDIDFPLMSYLFDRLLGVPSPRDYVSEFLARTAPNPAGGGTHREPHRAAGTRPSLAAAEYAGTYQHDYLGTLRVTLERDSTLGMQQDRVPSAGGPLEHWHHDSFVAHLRDGVFGDARVTFRLGADGRVQSLIYSLTGPDEWVRVRGTEASRP